MLHLKNLLLCLQQIIRDTPAVATKEVRSVMREAHDFLSASKSFEYAGNLKLSGFAIKLLDIGMDLDDVLRAMNEGHASLAAMCEIYLIITPKDGKEEKQ